MNRTILIVLAIVVIVGTAYAVSRPAPIPVSTPDSSIPNEPTTSDTPDASSGAQRVVNPEIGLAFSFTEGENGYFLTPVTTLMDTSPEFASGYTLVRTEDTLNVGERTEGPPMIGIRVYRNPLKQFPLQWAEQNPTLSNINLILGETTEAVVGGANALRYRADGLYATETTIVMSGSFAYVITGGFIDANDQIRTDYENLLKSIEFVPEI